MTTALRTHRALRTLPRSPLTLSQRSPHVPMTAIALTHLPQTTTPPPTRALSTTSTHRASTSHSEESHDADHGHESHYDPPTGWLWGIPPGQKYEKEGWENIWYYGFFGSLGLTAVAYAFKPDTSIETWALEEATRRLQKEGLLPDEGSESS